MAFQLVRIRDLCEVTSSKRIFASQYVEKGIPFYRSREIIEKNNGKEELSEPLFIEENVYQQINLKFGIPKEGDMLLTSVGTLGIPYIVKKEAFYFKDGNLTWFRNFNNAITARYLFYWFSSKFGRENLVLRAIGSSQPALTIDILKKHKVLVPDIGEQKTIVAILEKYDFLIENNNKKIKDLEQMTAHIYKEWFIRFRYPNHILDELCLSKIGNIPDSFCTTNIGSVIDYYVGGGWGNDDPSDLFPVEASVIRGADFPYVSNGDVSSCPKRFHKISNYEPRQLKENDIVFEISGGTEEQPVGRSVIVTKGILEQLSNKAICASFCKLIRPDYKKVTPYFFYYWLQYLYDTRIIDRYQLQSTGITNFQFEYFLRKGFCLVPPFELMEKFDSIVGPMRKEIDDLAMMNANLKKQRDMLLPRLMSGKLDVSGKEII